MNKIFFLLTVLLMIYGCKKADKDSAISENNVIMSFTFDKSDSIGLWNVDNGASLSIDNDVKISGSGSLHSNTNTNGYFLDLIDGIQVKPNTNYQLSFKVKITGLHIGGPSNFTTIIKQGTNNILYESLDSSNWKDIVYYFHSDSVGLPVKLRFMIGVTDIWIDQLLIKQIDNTSTKPLKMSFTFNNTDSLSFFDIKNGTINIDNTDKYEGNSSLNIQTISGCGALYLKDYLMVKKSKNYKLSVYYKNDVQYCSCVGYFITKAEQGMETILYESEDISSSWSNKVYYFSTDNTGLPVKLYFLFGTKNAWIDNFIIQEIE